MKELFKRMAALLLAAALVIGFFPALARAETTATEISSLEEITDLAGSYILTGDTPAGETATAEATDLEGFTFDETNENNVTSGTVTEDGSLVLKLYYSRNSYTLTWDVADGTITSEEGTYTAGSVKYEAPSPLPLLPQQAVSSPPGVLPSRPCLPRI